MLHGESIQSIIATTIAFHFRGAVVRSGVLLSKGADAWEWLRRHFGGLLLAWRIF